MRMWRSHPILFAALLGAIVGFLYAAAIEVSGQYHKSASGAFALLWRGTTPGGGANPASVMQTVFVLCVEVVGNVVGYALLFALPVALVVGIRRAVGRGRGKKP